MFGLSIIDWVVIALYFLVVLYIGYWAMKRIKNQEDYFLGGRRFGKLVQVFAAFGQATSADSAVSSTTTTMANGASGIWSALNYVFGTPVYWFTAPWYRRLRLLTMGDFFYDRYRSFKMGAIYTIVSVVGLMMVVSLGYNAMAKTVLAMTPKSFEQLSVEEKAEYNLAVELEGLEKKDYNTLTDVQKDRLSELRIMQPRKVYSHFSRKILIVVVTIVVLLYAVAGGLEAAFITDTIQGIFILILSIMLIPFAWAKINTIYGGDGIMGALTTIHDMLPESYFEILGSPNSIDFTWYYILALTVMITVNLGVQANQLVTTGSAKDEFTARFGFSTGLYLKRACTVLWGVFALAAVLLYSNSVVDPDLVFGHATLDLLGPLNMGLVGLMIACLMAALMSSADCLMITSSSLITHNLYRKLFPDMSEKHYVMVGRFSGAIVVIGGALIALQFNSIFQQLKLSWEITAVFAATFWLGMLWRRANRKAAWASSIVTLLFFFVLPMVLPALPGVKHNDYLLKMTSPAPLTRNYTAHQMDVDQRAEAIYKWDELSEKGLAVGERPQSLSLGEKFSRTYKLPERSVFWTMGVTKDANGEFVGNGMLNLELVLLDKLGFDLSQNPYSLNETIRVIFKILIPFGVLFIVGLITRPDEKEAVDRFFVKMKTPVLADPESDKAELEKSYANPARFDHQKMFPKSNWEFCKWNKVDGIGFAISCCVAAFIVGMLFLVVSIGA